MLDKKLKTTLKMKGLRMLGQYMKINYFVSVDHMVGFLGAQTNVTCKKQLDTIKPDLIAISAEIFAEQAQHANVGVENGQTHKT